MNRKWIGALILTVFVISSTFGLISTISGNVMSSQAISSSNSEEKVFQEEIIVPDDEDTPVPSEKYYDDIGEIYDVETDDGVIIKMLRYHAPRKSFNYGSQPILLFPGIVVNINQYLIHTTATLDELYDIELPDDLEDWAEGDENIEDDPLLYYSLAYYLWKIGYDPWFANYRGIGIEEAKSERGNLHSTLDHWALYDTPAAVRKVYQMTNQHPFIGGHSSGGYATYTYLQGCTFKTSMFGDEVVSYQYLADERNGVTEGPETIKGFIGIEPAMCANVPSLLDNALIWLLLDPAIYIDIRAILDTLSDIISSMIGHDLFEILEVVREFILSALDVIFSEEIAQTIKDFLMELILNVNFENVNAPIFDHLLRYTLDNLYTQCLNQYLDFAVHGVVREHYENGPFGRLIIEPPTPEEGDGYYYYTDNMDKVKVATLAFFADHNGEFFDLVVSGQVIEDLMEAKTPNEYDEIHIIDNTAHNDLPIGLTGPGEIFPTIGAWLSKVIPSQ